jgi:hypothetical protein
VIGPRACCRRRFRDRGADGAGGRGRWVSADRGSAHGRGRRLHRCRRRLFLVHAKGLRLRPRVSATPEVESGINDPFAIFLTIVLVEILLVGSKSWPEIATLLVQEAMLGAS